MNTIQSISEIITWTTEAAREHVDLARLNGEQPDPEHGGMGLWQTFQRKFLNVSGVDRDLQVAVHAATWRSTVKALLVPMAADPQRKAERLLDDGTSEGGLA